MSVCDKCIHKKVCVYVEMAGSPDEFPDEERECVHYSECRPTGEWIPVKYRPLTTEERIDFAEYYGIEYSDTVDEKAFDCHMPDDGQEILISTRWGVSTDVADNDIDGGYSTYGLEGNGDWEGIDAWMPLPEPYKGEHNNEQQRGSKRNCSE